MMPYWGEAELARIALDSVLAQDDPRWSLTVLDDQYPDPTFANLVTELARTEPRVRYQRNSENLGPSRNYNQAVGLAEAEYVTILGCDDRMLPNYVGRVHALADAFPGVDIIQPGVEVIDGDGTVYLPLADRVKNIVRPRFGAPVRLHGTKLANSLMNGNWTYFPSLAWRTATIRDRVFREHLNVVQDLAMIMDIVLAGGTLGCDVEVAFQYRRHRESYSAVTGQDGTKFFQELALFRELAQRMEIRGWRGAARRARLHAMSRLNALAELPGALARRDDESAKRLALFAFGFWN